MTTPEQFQAWLAGVEGRRLEFKAASGGFHFEELVKYCVALGNEGGGTILLGVTDRRPRRVLGTRAFAEPVVERAGQGFDLIFRECIDPGVARQPEEREADPA